MALPLALMHRVEGRVVLVMGDDKAALEPKRRFVQRSGGVVMADLAQATEAGARLAFLAYADDAEAATMAERARAKGMLVNVVDRPELCDFTTPAVIDRDPVVVAIGTGGASAGLAKHLRLRLEALLPPGLGSLALALEGAREVLRRRFPDPAARRLAIDAALEEGGPLDPFDPAAAGNVARWAEGAAAPGRIEPAVIQPLSDDPDDLTLRQARLLGRADVVFHESGVPSAILARARTDAERRLLPAAPVELERSDRLSVVIRIPRPAQAASASAGASSAK